MGQEGASRHGAEAVSRKPSPETELRSVKRELREAKEDLSRCRLSMAEYRARATRAEQSCAEWQQRFDALLKLGLSAPQVTGPAPLRPDQCAFCGGSHGAGMPCPRLAPISISMDTKP